MSHGLGHFWRGLAVGWEGLVVGWEGLAVGWEGLAVNTPPPTPPLKGAEGSAAYIYADF